MRRLPAVLAALAVLGACGGDDVGAGVSVTDAWARTTPAGVTVGAVYLRASSDVGDELVGADVDPAIAQSAELHTTETAQDGTATMAPRRALDVPAGGELVLEPIGSHLMLVGLADPLTTGETFDVTLHFATAGEQVVQVQVRGDAP